MAFTMFMLAVNFLLDAARAQAQEDDFRVCTDRRSYPPKVVIVCKGCQCPAGYH